MKIISILKSCSINSRLLVSIFAVNVFANFCIAMEKPLCPVCVRRPVLSNWDRNICDDLYNAVRHKNNAAIRAILSCEAHKSSQMAHIALEENPECTPFLRAVVDNNLRAIESLVKAGADPGFTNRDGMNLFTYARHRNRDQTIAVVMDSLSTFYQVDSLCRVMFHERLDAEGKFNGKILCQFLNVTGKIMPIKFSYFNVLKQKFVFLDAQRKLEEFYELQRKKIQILLSHAQGTAGKLPPDMTRYITQLVFNAKH